MFGMDTPTEVLYLKKEYGELAKYVASAVNMNRITGGFLYLGARLGVCDKVSPSLIWVNVIK